MSRARPILFFTVIVLFTSTLDPCLAASARARAVAPALFMLQSSTFQRPTPPPAQQDPRVAQCTRQTADWERNRVSLSLFLGFIIFLIVLYLLTWLRFKNTVVRVIVAFVLSALGGPAIMAVILQDKLKVCLNPPGFIGSLTAPLFAWTFGGSLGTLLVICILRYLVMRRKFRQELPAA